MDLLSSIGQVSGSKLINDSKNTTQPLATLSQLATFTGLTSETLSPFGIEGSAVTYQGEMGKSYQVNLKAKKPYSALYFDATGVVPLYLATNSELAIKPNGLFGFLLMRQFDSSSYRCLEIDVQELNPAITPQPFYTIGGATGNGLTQTYTLPNQGANISRLSKALNVDLSATVALEGSAIVFSLPSGTYSFELDAQTATDTDELYAWNGNEMKKLWGFGSPAVTTADSVYGWLAFISLEKVKGDGEQQFIIKNLTKTDEITYQVPEILNLIPTVSQGAVKPYDDYLRISNGTGSLPVDANFPLTLPADILNPIEASFAEFNCESGEYEVKFQISTTESIAENDTIYWYDGLGFTKLADRAIANIGNDELDPTRWVSGVITATLDVTAPKLGFLVVDTESKSGTTEIRILDLKKIPVTP